MLYTVWEVNAQFQGYFVSAFDNEPFAVQNEFQLDKLWGLALNLSYENRSYRMSYHDANVDLFAPLGSTLEQFIAGLSQVPALVLSLIAGYGASFFTDYVPNTIDTHSSFLQTSLVYNDGSWYIAGEFAK